MRTRNPHFGFGVEGLEARRLFSGQPAISISDVTLAEGDSGQTAFVFTVSLSKVGSREVSVRYAAANGFARSGDSDFVGASGSLKFAPGETTKTIAVLVNGDTAVEAAENFFVNLSRPRNAVMVDEQGVGTILNDDASPPPPPPTWEYPEQPYSDTEVGPYYYNDPYSYGYLMGPSPGEYP